MTTPDVNPQPEQAAPPSSEQSTTPPPSVTGSPAAAAAEEENSEQADALVSTIGAVVFPTYKPRDIGYGVKSGLYNIGSGCVAGATALVTAPIVGAKTGGAKGFAQGLGAGLLMGVALPVTGVVNGIRQIGRGAYNTYDSIEALTTGKVWDSEKECWIEFVEYNLKDEAATILNQTGGGSSGDGTNVGSGEADGNLNPNNVKDMHYYDLLGVASNANPGQVKKGYYKEARKCHPDRHPDDPEAHAKFQTLGEAYRILSSDQLRAYYDKYGRDDSQKSGGPDAEMQMDMAKLFFAVMFGGEKFEPYIGQLGLTAVVDGITQEMQSHQMGKAPGGGLDFKKLKKTQLVREVQCAVNLASRLNTFVEGREDEFVEFLKTEVTSLSKATFGEPLLHAIGEAYLSAATKYLGYKEGFLGVDGWMASMKQKARSNSLYFDVASKGMSSVSRMQKMAEISEKSRLREMEDPVPPTQEMVDAKQEEYMTLSVKELKEICKTRFKNPGSSMNKESDMGLDVSMCVEKKEIVNVLVMNDALVFADLQNKHEEWKAAGCQGPSPARDIKPKPKPPKPTTNKENGDEGADGAGGGGDDESAQSPFGMGDEMSPEDQAAMKLEMEGSLPVFLSALVSASLLDVEVTLKPVLKKVLDDHSVTEEHRTKRARALLMMGTAFVAAVGANKGARGEVEAKHVLEGTMMKTMAKAQGQEVDDDDDYASLREEMEKNQKDYQSAQDEKVEEEFENPPQEEVPIVVPTPPPQEEEVSKNTSGVPDESDLD
mmetsp:Transcript_48320/g.61992  ORF Transcript_48320/g.61992 Transcript_48320/m.61992 type:complete len:770 (-) Transcript_48320:234-2543(-)